MFGGLVAHVRAWLTRSRVQRELDEELRFHVEAETEANIERGIPPAEARRLAQVALGGVEQTRLAVWDLRRTVLDTIAQDLRYAVRRLGRARSVSTAAILTLGLTVGLATAVYSVAHAILLHPFPYARSDRLLAVWKATAEVDFYPLPIPELLDVKSRARTVEDIGGFTREGFALLAPAGARWADAFLVTTNLLDVLGVHAIKGRTFLPEDGEPGREKVTVIGEPLWRQVFDGDPNIVGRTVRLKAEGSKGGAPEVYRIVGVVASEVEIFYPARLRAQLYVPWVITPEDRSEQARSIPSLITVARLRPGVPVSEGAADIRAVMAASAAEHPAVSFPGATSRAVPLHEELVGRTRPAFFLLAAAAGLLLLIGCVNVANLLLASGLGRRPEFAARLAIGCSRPRLFRQLVTEHLLLAIIGGGLGVGLAAWATPMLRRLAPDSLPRAGDIRVDGTALAVAIALSLLAWLVSGLVPAATLAGSGNARWHVLGSRTVTRGSRRLRSALVIGQTALVLLLLVAAALLTKGMWRLAEVDLGFRAKDVFVAQLTVPQPWWWRAGPRLTEFERDLVERLSADGRFAGVSTASELPFTWGVLGAVRKSPSGKPTWALVAAISDRYLPLLDIRLHEGRMLDRRDDGNARVAVVNEELGRRLFQGGAVGRRLLIGGEWREVVGTVGNVTEIGELRAGLIRRAGFDRLTLPAAYVPIGSMDCSNHFLLSRTSLDAASAAAVVQKQVQGIEPEATIRRSGWLEERVDGAGADIRFCALVIGVFALAALALGAVGVYGVLANAVHERTLEIGIRTALGASPRRITWTVTRTVVAAVVLGCGLGLGAVLAAGHLLRAFLFEVVPTDPWTLAGTIAFLLIVAALAACQPVRALTRLDPSDALRCE